MSTPKARELLRDWPAVRFLGNDTWTLAAWAEPCGRAMAGIPLDFADQRCMCGCMEEVTQPNRDGRQRVYFSNACRQRHYRIRRKEGLT